MDWNHDGKQDWRDDALYHNVIAPNENEGSSNHSKNISGDSSTVSVFLPIVYLGLLLPGTIPINCFTMLIGLVCVGALAVKFLKWLYK